MEYRAETRTTRLLSAADMKYYILFDHCYRNDKLTGSDRLKSSRRIS